MIFAGEILTQTQHVHNDMAENDRYFTISIYRDKYRSSLPPDNLVSPVADKLRQALQVPRQGYSPDISNTELAGCELGQGWARVATPGR